MIHRWGLDTTDHVRNKHGSEFSSFYLINLDLYLQQPFVLTPITARPSKLLLLEILTVSHHGFALLVHFNGSVRNITAQYYAQLSCHLSTTN